MDIPWIQAGFFPTVEISQLLHFLMAQLERVTGPTMIIIQRGRSVRQTHHLITTFMVQIPLIVVAHRTVIPQLVTVII